MNYFAIFVLLVSVIWVYFDASKLNQKASQLGVTINLIPIIWALLTLVFWIVFFPMYLYTRTKAQILLNNLYQQGDTRMSINGIKPIGILNKALLLPVLMVVLLLGGVWGVWAYLNRLPDCANEQTLSLLKGIVQVELAGTDNPKLLAHFNELVKVDISAVQTILHSKDPARYTCAAQVKVDLGPEVQAALGISQEMIDNPNLFTALIVGPALQQVYGPLENLQVAYTSSWATEQQEKRHYVSAELSNRGATGYATLTEIAWARMQEKKTPEVQPVIPTNEQTEATKKTTSVPVNPNAVPSTVVSTPINAGIAQKLSNTWLEAMSKAQSAEEITSLYADHVDFYGKPNVSREVIAREKASFINRWSQRSYHATSPAQVTRNAPDEISWSQAFSYDVSDGTKTRSGQSTLAFTVKRINGAWLIVAERKGE